MLLLAGVVLAGHVLALARWPKAAPPPRAAAVRVTLHPLHIQQSPQIQRTAKAQAPRHPATAAAPRADPPDYWPAALLDRRPTPVSAPDPQWLDTLADQPISGLPLRLRLRITASGVVVGVEPVQVSETDAFALPALEAMFRATAFVPGRLAGRDVASQIELELHLDGGPP